MSATAFINSMKSMQFAVKDTRELLDLPQLSQAEQDVPLDGRAMQLRDVSFSYGGQDGKEVLHHLELTIPQGKFTALVGPSGGGKSTIARLAARFWDVTSGSITLGGHDIRELPLKQLSREISFVTQDNFLFDCSRRRTSRLGRPGASDEEVFAAAKAAQCEEFVSRLEHGWDTAAGDAGKQLSGGERQRIAIARAILKDAPGRHFWTRPPPSRIRRMRIRSSGPSWALSKGKTLLVIATGSHPFKIGPDRGTGKRRNRGPGHPEGTASPLPAVSGLVGSPCRGTELGRDIWKEGGELRCFIVSDAFYSGQRVTGNG